MTEGTVARPKIIESQPDAEVDQVLNHASGYSFAPENGGLRDLQHQPARVKT